MRFCLLLRRSSSSSTCRSVQNHLRLAQSAEAFRAAYCASSGTQTSLTHSDIDYLVEETYTRPSINFNTYQALGWSLGTVTRFVPTSCTKIISSIVDETSRTQLNNSIREMQEEGLTKDGQNEDVKEALKFHRDCRISSNDDVKSVMNENIYLKVPIQVASTSLALLLSLSKSL